MPTIDYWNGYGNWAGNPADWSLGAPPTASEDAEIQSGSVTLNTVASVADVKIDSASLYITRPGSLSVSGNVTNAGYLDLASNGGDGGGALTIAGTLTNSYYVYIGNTSLSASTRLTAGSLNNTGTINIAGLATVRTTHQATLEITGAAPSLLTGQINLYGDALLQLDSGTIQTIAGGGQLFLQGGSARVSAGAGITNSGLANLSTNAGNLYLEGNYNVTHGGVTLSTNLGLANIGTFHVDAGTGSGGSNVSFGGSLYTIGTTTIGNSTLSLPTTVAATGFANIGNLTIQGNQGAYTNKGAELAVAAAAPTALTASLSLYGDAELAFAEGSSIQMIGPGAGLLMDGGGTQITATGDGANSALSALASNAGSFDVEGNWSYGPGGTSIYTNGDFTNTSAGTFRVDYQSGAGDSAIGFGGSFNNYGSTTIGNTGLSLPTTVTASGYANSGSLTIEGDQTYQAINQALLQINGDAPSILTGAVSLYGDAELNFYHPVAAASQPAGLKGDASSSSSSFDSIGYNASLLENGGQAWVGDSNSELSDLSLNDGKISLQGNANGSSDGVTLTTDSAFANVGEFDVDNVNNYAGGSGVSIGGALTNAGLIHNQSALLSIGNGYLGAPTTVSASSLASSGRLYIVGNAQLNASNQAALIIAGAAPAAITGTWEFDGDALLQFGSGSIKTVDNGSALSLNGVAQVTDSGDAPNSALSNLANNFGTFVVGSNNGSGAGDETVAISTGLLNTGDFYVDQSYDGGSTISIAGKLTNSNTIQIGNTSLNAATSVSAGSLTNTGSLYLEGSASAANQAVLHVAGAAGFGTAGVLTGTVQLNGDSLLEFDSGSIATIAANATLDIETGRSPNGGFLADASDTTHNSALTGLSNNAGTFGLAFGAVVTTASGTAFSNTGTLNIDNFAGSPGGSALNIGGVLTNRGTMTVGAYGPSVSTTVSATSLANYGAVSLQGSATAPTTFTLRGAASNYGTLGLGSNTTLNAGAHPFNQLAGTATVAGAVMASAINAEGGLLDFTGPVTSTGTLNILGGGTMEFAAPASQTVNFQDATGVLELGAPGTFTGTIAGYSGNDIIDLLNTSVTGLSYASHVLTVSGSSGTVASLNFSGTYTNSSFAAVSDGHGGTDILLTPISQWNGANNVNWNSANWDVTPTSTRTAVLAANGGYTVDVTTAIDVGSIITTDPYASIYVAAPGATDTVENNLINGGGLYVDTNGSNGGSTLAIGGALVNTNQFTLGVSNLTADSTVTAASLDNSGTIDLWGNNSLSPSHQATLDITGAAPSVLTGNLLVHGDSLVEFGSGGVTAIAKNAELQLDGVNSRLSIGAGTTNSALAGLASNAGTFDMEGNWSTGPGGSSVTTTTSLANSGTLSLDVYGGDGASSLSIGGTLNNTGTVNVGVSNLSANSTLSAKALIDNGVIDVTGDNSTATGNNQARLLISGAAPTELDGRLQVWGDALVQFGSGSLTKIGTGGQLAMDGSRAQISDKNGSFNSALSKLATNAGSISLNGNSGYGSGGESVTTTVALTNLGTLIVDEYGGYGGTSLTIGGALNNQGGTNNSQGGQIVIGNSSLSADTTVTASSLVNNGTINLWGSEALNAVNQATLDITGAATTTLTGSLLLHGDSLVEFASGGVTSIAAGAELQLDGVNARMSIGAGTTNSALAKLASNAGLLDIEGDWSTGPGGSSVATTAAFTNTGTFEMDVYSADGASSFSTTQGFINEGAVTLGNTSLSANTTLTAKSLTNRGSITLWGDSSSSPTHQTILHITGTGPASLTGDLSLHGDSMMEYASGSTGATSIAAGATLQLAGAHAVLSVGAGTTNSALAKLTNVAGVLDLEGNWNGGPGGVTVTTTTGLTNTGTVDVDVNNGGGSAFTIGGALTNVGAFNIGSYAIGAATTVSAKSLVNSGTISVTSSSSYSSTFTLTGAATNNGVVSIGAGSVLDASGHAYTQNAGTTTVAGTLKASSVEDYGGLINFTTAVANGNGTGALNIHAGGIMEFGASVGTGHTVTFEDSTGMLQLGAPATFAGTIAGFSANDVIDLLNTTVTSFTYSAHVLTLYNGATQVGALKFAGTYTAGSFTTVSDGHGGTDIVDPPTGGKTKSGVSADQLVQSIAAFGGASAGVGSAAMFASGPAAQRFLLAASPHS